MSDLTKNTTQLEKLELQLIKQNSLLQSFLRGLVAALGATVGLSIFLALLAVIISYIAEVFGLQNILDPILQSSNIGK